MLVAETLALLGDGVTPPSLVVDGTVGYGGHAEAMLAAWPACRLLGLDRDEAALTATKRRLARFAGRVRLFHASYADLPDVLEHADEGRPAAVLLDLGVSSPQLDVAGRGFSFRAADDPADMRFDAAATTPTAADLVNTLAEAALARLVFEEGGERRSRAVARALVAARPVRTVGDLVRAIERVVPRDASGIHPATRTFQALRMAVNDERAHLERGLAAAIDALAPGGRLVVLCFHSGEERAVKAAFAAGRARGRLASVVGKSVRATAAEVARNPRASSARLRAAVAAAG